MSTLKSAIELAKQGFHVFPIVPNSKTPAIKNFPNDATRDEKKIKQWWLDPVLGLEQPYNVGISTSRFGDNEHLVVIDIDNKDDKRGDDELKRLQSEGLELPDTFEQRTPTGGRHLIYRTPKAVPNSVSKLAKGLDIRGRGGYLVGAGSVLKVGAYTAVPRHIADAPEWLYQRLSSGTERQTESKTANTERTKREVDSVRARSRATLYLKKEAPIAIEGDGGDQTTFKVAARVKDFGVPEAECLELMLEHWNPRCTPPWQTSDLSAKVRHAYKYGLEPVGSAAPETQFPIIPTEEQKSYLRKINETYALVYVEGGHFILNETVDEKGNQKRTFLNEATFKRRFSPFTVQSGRGRPQTWADIWLDWEGRREYQGVCFAPEREPRHNYYNLWRGFTCKPITPEAATPEQSRGLEMFLEHAKENVCHNDEKLFNWLVGYFAHMIQKPYERPLTTLVFKGRKGTGKNALVDRVGRLLGHGHYLVAQDGRYLTSNFNGHLDSCLMLVLDEAFWSGDKAAEAKIKGLTTSPEIMIERKGKEPYQVDNLVRLVVIGNEEWLVPATADERRFAVFQMGEARMQDQRFFESMRVLLDDKGGSGLLLHYLKNFDLKRINVNHAPSTEALLDQKMSSLDSFYQYWFDCLEEGRLIFSDFSDQWEQQVTKETFRDSYRKYIKDRNIKTGWLPNDIAIGKRLKACLPSLVSDGKRRENGRSVWMYKLPDLDQARFEWELFIGHKVKWK